MSTTLDRRSFLLESTAAAGLLTAATAGKAFAAYAKGSSASPIADTTAGKVQGSFQNKVNAFRGIPYGASTTGAGRFMPPAKPQPWTGVRESVELGTRCAQLPSNTVPEYAVMEDTSPMGEDCLRLNVWTQGLKDGHKRPVMVWLHGGGYVGGSGGEKHYNGANLAARHDVVVVGLNHRLNIFGFLHLTEVGGERFANASNAGILDIILALEWVRDNIANFGGDPGNVTIFGQSGGGGKVSTLLGMPGAKGLFHRAIAQSGSAVTGISSTAATKTAEAVMDKLGLKPNQVDELQKVPTDQLLSLQTGPMGVRGFGPVTDGHSLPAVPFDPVATQISADVPLIIGSNETEITWIRTTTYEPLDDTAFREKVKQAAHTSDAEADKLIASYHHGRPKASNLDLYLILGSDFSNFRAGTDTEAERKAELGKAAVYKHYFQWYSPVRGGQLRAMHTMELPFMFMNLEIGKSEVGDATKEMMALSEQLSGAWVAFARSGNPNHKGLPHWAPFNADQRATMIFNTESKAVNDPYREERLARLAVKAG